MNKKRIAIAAVLVLVFAVGLFGFALAQSKPGGKAGDGKTPKVIIENKTVQLGEVIEGQEVSHTFSIKNVGAVDLQILSVKPG
jgi:Flp pilus assembly protein CpaB